MEYSWRVFHIIDREKFLIFLWSAFYRLSLLMMKHQEDWKCWPCMANRFIHWHAEYRLSSEATSFSWSATSETQTSITAFIRLPLDSTLSQINPLCCHIFC
jgi:hypothetical protein